VALRSRIGQFTKPFYSKSATMKIRLLIPDVNAHPTDRPRACVYCAKAILQRHGTVPKPIKDHEMGRVETHRYKCTCCHRIFRHYPQGVTAKDQSQRTVVLAALMYGLRLSCSAASHLLWALGVEVSKMSVWRDAQEAGEALRRKRPVGKVWVLGADETVYKVSGQEVVVGFLTDAGGERTLGFEVLTEGDGHAVGSGWNPTPENSEPRSSSPMITTPMGWRVPSWVYLTSCVWRTCASTLPAARNPSSSKPKRSGARKGRRNSRSSKRISSG
jgi:hypothetical protein